MVQKRGISLIVLVITIVVVIILSVAIILSLSNNNPINNSKVASLVETKEKIQSGILTYVAKIEAQTAGKYNTEDIIIGETYEEESLDKYRIVEKDGEEYVTCKVIHKGQDDYLYKIDESEFVDKIGSLPDTPTSESSWYVNQYGKVYLVFDSQGTAPRWMTNKDRQMDSITLTSFITHKENATLGDGVSSEK